MRCCVCVGEQNVTCREGTVCQVSTRRSCQGRSCTTQYYPRCVGKLRSLLQFVQCLVCFVNRLCKQRCFNRLNVSVWLCISRTSQEVIAEFPLDFEKWFASMQKLSKDLVRIILKLGSCASS